MDVKHVIVHVQEVPLGKIINRETVLGCRRVLY